MGATAVRVIDQLAKMADFAGPPTNGAVHYRASTGKFTTALTRIVYASSIPGAVGNATADAAGTYGTNDSAAWQAVINDAETAGDDLCIVNDVPTLIDTITPAGHVAIRGAIKSPRCGLYRKGRPNGGRTMILNKHSVLGPTTPTDQFISISDLYIDENQRGYGSGNTGTHMAGYDDDTFQHVFNDLGYIVHCIGLYGVRFFRVGNIYVYDSTGYALNLGNCQDGHVHDFRKYNRPGNTVTYDPVIQTQGHCHRIDYDRIGGEARDDALAVNANDGQDDPAATVGPEPGQVAPGPISDLTFRDCKFGNVMQVCRFISAHTNNPITNVTFDGVSATIGAPGVPAPGYAGFQIDDFGLTGPLTDGSHGLVDGLKILNVVVNGTNTGGGEGYGSVHLGQCNVKRLEIRNYRYRGYSIQPIAVVHSTANAKVETLILEKVVNESILPIAPVLTLKGDHQVVMVDGIEYDMLAAGPDYPQPQFRDAEMIRVAGPVKSLIVGKARGAGLSHLVKCIGFAPANLSVTNSSLLGSNGGAAVKSDTPLPWLHIAGVDADHCEDVPAGSMIKSDGSGRYDSRYLRDLFAGTANALIAGSTATDGSVWQADAANHLKASGNGTAFLGGASSFTAAAVAAQPTTPSFTVIFPTIRISSISASDGIGPTLFATGAGDLTDHYWVRFASASYDLMHNTTVVATSGLIPAVGGTRWVRAAVYAVPNSNDKRVTIDYSDDVGRSWANLIPTAYVTTTTPALVGLRGVSTAGWTSTTGHHVGPIVVASFNGPVPGPYVPPVTTPVFNLMANAGTLQTVGGTPATADNDPVGQDLDQSGNAHHASIATAGFRPLLKTAVQNGLPVMRFDGVDDKLIVPNYTIDPPFTLFFVVKMTTAINKQVLGWGNNGPTGVRYGVWLPGGGVIAVENAGTVRSGSLTPTVGGFHVVTQRLPDATFANLTQRINGATDTMTGGSGTMAFSGTTELRVGGLPTIDGYEVATDIAEIYLVGSYLGDVDCATVEAALKTKWGTP